MEEEECCGHLEEDGFEDVGLIEGAERRAGDGPRSASSSRSVSPDARATRRTATAATAAWVKVGLIALASVLISSTGLCMRSAEVDGEILYNVLSVTFFSELVKLVIACAVTAATPTAKATVWDRRSLTYFAPGAVGYFVLNNVRYYMIRQVNPGLLAIVWNMKIVTIGLFYRAPPFRRDFSRQQWMGALILVLGSSMAELSQWGTKNDEGQSNTGGAAGAGIVAFALVLTSFSAVACEFAYKATPLPLSRQNMILYAYGTGLNCITAAAWSIYEADGVSWTANFTAWTWAVVLTQALSGYAIGALLKYVDAVGQVFADVVSMFVAALASALLFGLVANFEYNVSLFLSCVSLVVYYWDVIADAAAAAAPPSKDVELAPRPKSAKFEVLP